MDFSRAVFKVISWRHVVFRQKKKPQKSPPKKPTPKTKPKSNKTPKQNKMTNNPTWNSLKSVFK